MDKGTDTGFRIIDHEADVGLTIIGTDERELLQNGGLALFSLITDLDTVEERESRTLAIAEDETALVAFLNDLLYLWDTQQFLPRTIRVFKRHGGTEALLVGERFDPTRHPIRREVKAATYHKFFIEHEGNVVTARVFLDV